MSCPFELGSQTDSGISTQAFVPVQCVNLIKRHGIRQARAMLHVDERRSSQDPRSDPTKAWRFAMGAIATHVLYQTAKWNIIQDPMILEMVRVGYDSQRPVDDNYLQRGNRVLIRVERTLSSQLDNLTGKKPTTPSEAIFKQAYGEFTGEFSGMPQTAEEVMGLGIEVLLQIPHFKINGVVNDSRQRGIELTVNGLVDKLGQSFKDMDEFQAKLHSEGENTLRGMTLELGIVYNDHLTHVGFQKDAVAYAPYPTFSDHVLTALKDDQAQYPPTSPTYGCISRIPASVFRPLTPDLPYSRASALVDSNQMLRGILRRI